MEATLKKPSRLQYPAGMREEELRQYFLGQRSDSELSQDLIGSVAQIDQIVSSVQIVDMQESFCVTRSHLVKLCDAFIRRALSPSDLSVLAFALLASDTFEWDDEIVSEILSDWSAPEVNYVLNADTINMHRDWLLGYAKPSERTPSNTQVEMGNLLSVRTKTSCQ